MTQPPNIHIGILKSPKVKFRLSGKFNINNEEQNIYNGCDAYLNDEIIAIKNGNSVFEFKNEVTLNPCCITSDYIEIHDVIIGINFHWEQKENQRFQGALKLLKKENEIQVINIIPVENYLQSVISSEMSANSSLNLLKAHAIISRSWLLAQIEKQEKIRSTKSEYQLITKTDTEYIRWYDREDHSDFHVCADDHCQRYQGITKAFNPNVIKAVQETSGEVLLYNNVICDARFSKSCGGVTELFENCWEPINHPYLSKVVDNPVPPEGFNLDLTIEKNAMHFIKGNPEAFCNTQNKEVLSQVLNDYDLTAKDFYRWEIAYSQTEISELINRKSGIDFGEIIDLIPIERGESGRLIKLKIIGSKKTLIVGKELEIRRWLSESHLYSSAFTVDKKTDNGNKTFRFILNGAGWGHGVGLCQIGAAVMGEKGYNYNQILQHYFKKAEIKKYY